MKALLFSILAILAIILLGIMADKPETKMSPGQLGTISAQ